MFPSELALLLIPFASHPYNYTPQTQSMKISRSFIITLASVGVLVAAIPVVEVADNSIKHDLQTRGDDSYDDGSWSPSEHSDDSQYNRDSSLKDYDSPKYDDSYKYKCPSHRDTVPFLRTLYPDGVDTSPVIGWFFNWQVRKTVPLYLLFNPWSKDYFYTTDKYEKRKAIHDEGYQAQGVAGYLFPNDSCGGVPLFRLYDPKSHKHFYTTSVKEKRKAIDCGFRFKGVEGYVYKYQQW